MKAILLAAGFGKRLRPITLEVPKCLVPIGREPLLEIWLKGLKRAGVRSCLVNTHYLSKQVELYLGGSSFHEFATLVHEPVLLGTAGTVKKNLSYFEGEDGLIAHADNYFEVDLSLLMAAHSKRPSYCEITMMTFKTKDPTSCGVVELDTKGVVVGFHEKVDNPPTNLANSAVLIFSRNALAEIQNIDGNDLSRDLLPAFVGRIYNFTTLQPFLDIGTVHNLQQARQFHKVF